MSVLDHLVVELGIESGQFFAELTKLSGATTSHTGGIVASFNAMGSDLARVGDMFKEKFAKEFSFSLANMAQETMHLTKAMVGLGVALSAVGVGALAFMTKEGLASGDAMAKLSDRLQMSIEDVQRLGFAASQSGASVESMTTSLTFMQRAIGNAADGSKELRETFTKLKVPLSDLSGKTTYEQFLMIADALQKIESPAERTRLQMQILGRGAMQMSSLLNEGADGIKKLADAADKAGMVMNRIEFAKIEQAGDAMDKLGDMFSAASRTLAAELAPMIEAIANEFENAIEKGGGLNAVIRTIVENGIIGVGFLLDAWRGLEVIWSALKVAVGYLSVGMYEAVNGVAVAVSFIVDKFKQVGDAGIAIFNALWESVKLVWMGIKGTINTVMDGVVAIIGASLVTIGKALSILPGSIGESVETAGRKMVDGVRDNANKTAAELAKQAGVTKEAWSDAAASVQKVFMTGGNVDNAVTQYTGRMVANSHTVKDAYIKDLDEIAHKEMPSLVLRNWVEEARRASTEVAKIKAGESEKRNAPQKIDVGVSDEDKRRVEAMRDLTDKESEIELRKYNKNSEELSKLNEEKLISHEEFMQRKAALDEQHQDNVLTMENHAAGAQLKQWKSGYEGKMQIASSYLGNVATLMNSKNKEMFEIGKIAAYAQTIVNTAEAAMSSFKFGSALGGPVVGAAFAATAVAAGMVQLATISSAQFGGGGGVSSGGGGGAPSIASGPNGGTNTGIPSLDNIRQGPAINLTLQGENFTAQQVRDLIDQINEASRDGARVA